jgi:hypothetical protein
LSDRNHTFIDSSEQHSIDLRRSSPEPEYIALIQETSLPPTLGPRMPKDFSSPNGHHLSGPNVRADSANSGLLFFHRKYEAMDTHNFVVFLPHSLI